MSTTTNIIGAFEAKTYLSDLLEKVRAGQSFTITKRGEAIAELKPVQSSKREQGLAALAAAKKLRAEIASKHGTFTREEIKEMINEGRP